MDPSFVVARPASTVIALRMGLEAPEVLMVRRGSGAEFLGGAHVFPGGAVDDVDRSSLAGRAIRFSGEADELPWRGAALRELAEEAGIFLTDPPMVASGLRGPAVYERVAETGAVFLADRLEYLSNWVTPVGLPVRYDARFFVVEMSDTASAHSDRVEVFDEVWVSAREALRLADAGDWYLEFPTRRHVELLAQFSSVAEAIEYARSARPIRMEPRLVVESDGARRVLLPGDTGFEGPVP